MDDHVRHLFREAHPTDLPLFRKQAAQVARANEFYEKDYDIFVAAFVAARVAGMDTDMATKAGGDALKKAGRG